MFKKTIRGFRKRKHVMRILDASGDTKIEWDPEDDESVKEAEEKFNLAVNHKFVAHRIKRDGSQGRLMTEFDPSASSILLIPMIEGG